jgi:hypothetical protein
MATRWQIALSVGPLAFYLVTLARWHRDKHPRVVSGPADLGLLALGIGGFAVFGPLGQALVVFCFGRPSPLGWVAVASGLALVGLVASRRAWRRVVVYHVTAQALDRALDETIDQLGGRYVRTLLGFEEPAGGSGVLVEVSPRWSVATLEAYGRDPERLVRGLETRLRRRLRTVEVPASPAGGLFLAAALLVAAAPLVGWLCTEPHAREALRVLFRNLPGG